MSIWVWRLAGGFFFAAGAIFIFVPLMPTTIFWILAAICFLKSDPALAEWIYARPKIGPEIRAFVERGVMSKRGKAAALTGMALASAIIAALFWRRPWILGSGLALLAIGALFVATRPASPPSDGGSL
jgi:uncharacterized protein